MDTLTLLEKTERIAQIGSWEWDIAADIWLVSNEFRRMHGITYVGPLGTTDLLLTRHPEDRAAIDRAFADALAGTNPYDIEHKIIRMNDGVVRYVHSWGEVEFDVKGKPTRIFGAVQDITERREAELDRARLAAVVEYTDDPILTRTLDGVITSWNAAAERLFGYSAADIIGQSIARLLPSDEDQTWIHERIMRGESVPQFETKRIAKGERSIDVSVSISPIFDALGRVTGASAIYRDITPRMRMEAEIRRANAQYRLMFDHSLNAILLNEPEKGTIVAANPEACRLLGRPEAELLGLDRSHIMDQTDPRLAPAVETRARTGRFRGEVTFLRADGTPLPAEVASSIFKNADGQDMTVVFFADISERKAAEAALRASETQYRLLFDNSLVGVIVSDPATGELLSVNPQACRMLGFEEEELRRLGRSALIDIANPRVAAAIDLRSRVGSHRAELTLRCADGSRLPVDLASSLFTAASGRTLAGIFFMDISERRRAEDAMRVSEERYRQLADGTPLPVSVVDAETLVILYANPPAGDLFEVDARTVVGRSSTDFMVNPGDLATFNTAMARDGRVSDVELRMRNASGREFWVSMNSAITTYNGRPALHSVYLDISDRKRIEAEMRRLNDELEQRVSERTQQLRAALVDVQQLEESKDAFLASVSRDLRTPLTSVIGMADALELQFNAELDNRQIHHIQQIRQSGERLLKMVDSILHYTALVAGRVAITLEPCRLIELAAARMRAIRAEVEAKGLKLNLTVEPTDVEIVSDANGVIQVLDNLLDNALKFTPAGGAIGVDIVADPETNVVLLAVWDTGIGISPDRQEDIFKPFGQIEHGISREYWGVGLGLPYARQMVKLLGGSINVESTPGQGSRFLVTLPRDGNDAMSDSAWMRGRADVITGNYRRETVDEHIARIRHERTDARPDSLT